MADSLSTNIPCLLFFMSPINWNIRVVVSRSYCEIRLSVVNERPRDLSDAIRFSMTIWMASTLCSPVNILVTHVCLEYKRPRFKPSQANHIFTYRLYLAFTPLIYISTSTYYPLVLSLLLLLLPSVISTYYVFIAFTSTSISYLLLLFLAHDNVFYFSAYI